jgi:hypothetical protein
MANTLAGNATNPKVGGKGQVVARVLENAPDPRQSVWWDGLAEKTAEELSGLGAPLSIRAGMKGDPTVTWYGDPGPLGGIPSPSHGALNNFPELNADQALPGNGQPLAAQSGLQALVASFGN